MNLDLIKRTDIAPLSNTIKEKVHKSAYRILKEILFKILWNIWCRNLLPARAQIIINSHFQKE